MKAADVMTRRVVTVHPDASVTDAIHLMLQDEVSGLPVVDRSGDLVGIVTEGDFLRRAELGTERRRRRWVEALIGPNSLADEYVHTHARKVGDVMCADVVTVGPGAPLDEVVATMERHRIKRIPVVEGGKIVGIISRANLLRALASMTARRSVPARSIASDTAIRDRILGELDDQVWASATSVTVVVWDGAVHFWGTITDDTQRRALRVLAETVPGVTEVRDHLVCVEPMPSFVM